MAVKRGLLFGWFLTLAVILAGCGGKQNQRVESPDGQVVMEFSLEKGAPTYSLSYQGQQIIQPSTLGLSFAQGKPLQGPFKVEDVRRTSENNDWKPVWGKNDQIQNHYNQLRVELQETGSSGRQLVLEFRAYNDGAAFRYTLPKQTSLTRFALTGEQTTMQFNGADSCFALHRRGFGDNYEGDYTTGPIHDLDPQALIALPFLVHAENCWVGVTEADLTDYSGMSLMRDTSSAGGMRGMLAPSANDEHLKVLGNTPHNSPWRVFMLGEQAGDLIESDIVQNLNPPDKLKNTSWIHPGQVIWPWWNGRIAADAKISGEPSTALMKYYTDFAVKYNIPMLLVDAGWYSLESEAWSDAEHQNVLTMEETRKKNYDIRQVIDYANKKGVGVLLWVHLASLRNRVEDVLSTYAKWGAKGVKIDNYGGDNQQIVNDVRKVVEVAADHHLTVDFHGAFKPTGISRTYPNFLTREGVKGLEHSKGDTVPTTRFNVTIPYTRMLAGPMDYTPGAFDLDGTKASPKHVRGTRTQQIAMYIVYFSPLQMLVDYPAAYEASPDQFSFVRSIPTTWSETRFIAGYPGKYVVVARRQGEQWFVGAMTNNQSRDLTIPLDFLGSGQTYQATICRDAADAGTNPQHVNVVEDTFTSKDNLHASLAGGGGFAVRLTPAQK